MAEADDLTVTPSVRETAAVAGNDSLVVLDAVAEAATVGLVTVDETDGFAFAHEFVRAAIGDGLDVSDRLDAHARAPPTSRRRRREFRFSRQHVKMSCRGALPATMTIGGWITMGGDKLGRRWRLLVAAATTVALLGLGSGAGTAQADPVASADDALAAATQPGQPTQGPGGSSYAHGAMTVSSGGVGNDAWYVFQPTNPRPTSAPVAIMLHGFGEFSGHDSMYQFIRHTVRQGNVVIYPRWQTGIFSPVNIEGRMTAASNGIKGGLAWLRADTANRVQPQLDKVSYFGFSYGGIIATNLANRHASLSLPTPRVLFLDEPHDGFWEADLDDSLSGIPSSVRLNCLVSDDITAGEAIGCKTMWPLLGHIPAANKDYVVAYDDAYGSPALAASHGLSSSTANGTYLDAYDYYAVWKIFDALRSCTFSGTYCAYGLGNTAQHRSMGLWSDGRPVRELAVSDSVINP